MMTSPPRSDHDPRAFRAGLVFLSIIIAVAGWKVVKYLRGEVPDVAMADLRVVDQDRAIARFWGRGEHGYIALVDSKLETRWWKELPGETLHDWFAARSDLVVVSYAKKSQLSLAAFDMSGHQAWTLDLPEPAESHDALKRYSFFVGPDFYQLAPGRDGVQVYKIDAATGVLRTKQRVPSRVTGVVHVGAGVILQGDEVAYFSASATWEPFPQTTYVACVVNGDYITQLRGGSIVRLEGGDPSHGIVLRVGDDARLEGCGGYRDLVALHLDVFEKDGSRETREVLVDRQGAPVRTIELAEPGMSTIGSQAGAPEASLLRFVPRILTVYPTQNSSLHHRELVILDLELGTIASRKVVSMGTELLFEEGGIWYGSACSEALWTLDGTTGTLSEGLASSELAPKTGFASRGRMWIRGPTHEHSILRPSLALVDARTFEVIRSRGVSLRRVTPCEAETR